MLGESDASDIDEAAIPLATLDQVLENISLLTAVDSADSEDSRNKIALMTVHSAKGLEFPYVYVSGMEENLFPSLNMLSSRQDVEEERRLFYVAVTRAKKAVILTYCDTRMRNGKTEENSPSRFLREIDGKYISNPLLKEIPPSHSGPVRDNMWRGNFGAFGKNQDRRPSRPAPSSPSASPVSRIQAASRPLPPKIPDAEFVPETMDKFRAGQRVEHNRFGKGRILDISGTIPDLKARIAFDEYGEKLLLLKYAKLRFVK
ncbi:MAG: ATP-binding domain-containing protein, partial [Bacteroidales bacterium]|nr:ATP-binding domain-containing protein [Bacteroidales bacterium]